MRKTRKMRIYVGKCDINAGEPCDAHKCGIAQALQRRFPKTVISVGIKSTTIGKDTYSLCNVGQTFVSEFDMNKNYVKPCHVILTKQQQ